MPDDDGNRPLDFERASTPNRSSEHTWTLEAVAEWQQGRTLFGGLVAAALTRAMSAELSNELPLRHLSITFAAPINVGQTEIMTCLDRTGSSTAFTSATVHQNGSLTTRASAVFGSARSSAISVPPAAPTFEKDFATAEQLPYVEGLVPAFLQNIDMRWAIGDYPFTGSERGTLGGYCRFDPPSAGVAAVVGLLDSWPPAVLPMANGLTAGSTITWNAHFVGPIPSDPEAWFEFRYDTVSCSDGYATYCGVLSHQGRVIAWTEQLAAIFG